MYTVELNALACLACAVKLNEQTWFHNFFIRPLTYLLPFLKKKKHEKYLKWTNFSKLPIKQSPLATGRAGIFVLA